MSIAWHRRTARAGDRVLVVGVSFDLTGLAVADARDLALGAQP